MQTQKELIHPPDAPIIATDMDDDDGKQELSKLIGQILSPASNLKDSLNQTQPLLDHLK